MINLLPPSIKGSYRFAGRNVKLGHWLTISVLALVGLAAIGFVSIVYMDSLSNTYQEQIAAQKATLKQEKLAEVQADAKNISGNIKLAVQVLGKEVLFSKLLTQLAAITPPNTSLSALNINQTTGALDITAVSTNYSGATQLQVNLADPTNKIFSKADIVNINCDSKASNQNPKYPCTVTIRALFAGNNPFLFINANKGSQS
jgi:hypothetical protein